MLDYRLKFASVHDATLSFHWLCRVSYEVCWYLGGNNGYNLENLHDLAFSRPCMDVHCFQGLFLFKFIFHYIWFQWLLTTIYRLTILLYGVIYLFWSRFNHWAHSFRNLRKVLEGNWWGPIDVSLFSYSFVCVHCFLGSFLLEYVNFINLTGKNRFWKEFENIKQKTWNFNV